MQQVYVNCKNLHFESSGLVSIILDEAQEDLVVSFMEMSPRKRILRQRLSIMESSLLPFLKDEHCFGSP